MALNVRLSEAWMPKPSVQGGINSVSCMQGHSLTETMITGRIDR